MTNKSTGSLLASIDYATSTDSSSSQALVAETLKPAPVVRQSFQPEATDSVVSEQSQQVEPLRPNQICDKALKGTAHRAERKDLAIQGPLDFARNASEPKADSTVPKSSKFKNPPLDEKIALETTLSLDEKIESKIKQILRDHPTNQEINQLVVEPIANTPTKSDLIAHASHLELYKCNVDMTPINFPSIA